MKGSNGSTPIAMKTLHGWVVSGATSSAPSIPQPTINVQTIDLDISYLLRSFWEIEELPKKPLLTEEERLCEKFYSSIVERHSSGRYIVRLPLNETFPASGNLGDSYSIARRT